MRPNPSTPSSPTILRAAQMGFMRILDILILKGADIRRPNHQGETPLIRSVLATNNFDSQTFPALLAALADTLFMVDAKQRSLLHSIVLSAALKGRRPQAARYYADCLFEFLAAHPIAAASADGSIKGDEQREPGPTKASDNIRLKALVDMRDCEGDTALNIAARIGHVALVGVLLSVGANPDLPNHAGLCPRDFGMAHLFPPRGRSVHERSGSTLTSEDNEVRGRWLVGVCVPVCICLQVA
jgi:regulatory protein SWI6